jgi:hypothetical protein
MPTTDTGSKTPSTATAIHKFAYWVTFATIMGAETAESSRLSYSGLPSRSSGNTRPRQYSASAAPKAIERTYAATAPSIWTPSR